MHTCVPCTTYPCTVLQSNASSNFMQKKKSASDWALRMKTHMNVLQWYVFGAGCAAACHEANHVYPSTQSLSAAAQTTKVKDGKLQGAEYVKDQVNTAVKHVDAALKGYGS